MVQGEWVENFLPNPNVRRMNLDRSAASDESKRRRNVVDRARHHVDVPILRVAIRARLDWPDVIGVRLKSGNRLAEHDPAQLPRVALVVFEDHRGRDASSRTSE